ncbi:YdgA family protein [Buttiauxella gaviniae]|uniref:YdgA family protein n=1 Tax=Buttiauxella gaviniae TaxID=82990 RepID=UPI003975F3A5
MKKSLVAVGVIVALGVVWTGTAWYTGKQLEGRMAEMISNANTELNKASPEAGLTLGYQEYHRGLFSSTMQLVIKPTAGMTSAILKPDQTIVFNETIDHGPFPFAQLKKFNLLPSMASVHTTLMNNPTTKPLFDIAKGQSFIDAQTRIGYSGDTSSDINLLPLNYENGEQKVAFSGGEFKADVDAQGDKIAVSGEAQSGLVNTVNEYGQHVQMTFNGIKTEGNSARSEFIERIGSQKASIDKLSISIEGKEMAVVEGFNINAKSELQEDKKHLSGQIDYAINSLKVQNKDIGSGKLTLKIGNLDGAAVREFSQKYNAESQKLLADPAFAQNPEAYQQQIVELFAANLPLLLKGDPVITVAPLSWKNAKGESSFNLSLFLKDPAQSKGEPTTPEEQLNRVVKSLDSKLVIPVDMATELMTQVAQFEGYQPAEAAKLAEQQIKGLAAMGQMFRVTTMEGNNVVSSLQYSNGQVTLNGQKMALGDLLGMFGMPTMGEPEPAPAPELEAPAAPEAPAVPQQ